jgi:hypothetical protein
MLLVGLNRELWRKEAEAEETRTLLLEEKNNFERELNATIPRVCRSLGGLQTCIEALCKLTAMLMM